MYHLRIMKEGIGNSYVDNVDDDKFEYIIKVTSVIPSTGSL